MKTVICFDTEDQTGMENTFAIMEHLFDKYMDKHFGNEEYSGITLNKIPLIKLLREYGELCIDGTSDNGLRDSKIFADKVFKERVKRGYTWKRDII
jgi:hypothetical protein